MSWQIKIDAAGATLICGIRLVHKAYGRCNPCPPAPVGACELTTGGFSTRVGARTSVHQRRGVHLLRSVGVIHSRDGGGIHPGSGTGTGPIAIQLRPIFKGAALQVASSGRESEVETQSSVGAFLFLAASPIQPHVSSVNLLWTGRLALVEETISN